MNQASAEFQASDSMLRPMVNGSPCEFCGFRQFESRFDMIAQWEEQPFL